MTEWYGQDQPHRGPSEAPHSLSAVDRLTSTEPICAEIGLGPEWNQFRDTRQCITVYTYLEQLMDKNTGFVYHSNIQGAPILKERQIRQMVVDREVIVCCIVVWGCRGATSGTCSDTWSISWLHGGLVKYLRIGWGMRKRGKVEPVCKSESSTIPVSGYAC